jgi:hypothetical protein
MKITWPEGKKFAFTVFDDTDLGTVGNLSPVYTFLKEKGFLTTKSVWALRGDNHPKVGGVTCEDGDYLKWVKQLAADGFEIASHGVTYHTADREQTIKGYDKFYEMFGKNPDSYATHTGCAEGIYNGKYRVTGLNRFIYNLTTRFRNNNMYIGHLENNKLFWGDICKERIKYARAYVFSNINTLKFCPYMPFHDPAKPYVNNWFCSSEGAEINSFTKTISEKNQDQLEEEGGACIMYTHFACGFQENGLINERFKFLMERLSRKDGWFVPVNVLLDYLLKIRGEKILIHKEKKQLERKWLLSKFRTGST